MIVQLPALPPRISKLPIDPRGYPVPWFVSWHDGVPDFRLVSPAKIIEAHKSKKCWICGEQTGKFLAFVIGPMCAVNRVSGEPPSHRECAEFAARVCPFMVRPRMKRNEKDLPTGHNDGPGIMLKRNPGVSLIWMTKSYEAIRVDDGVLFKIGDPVETIWYAEGRPATREEIMASIESGLPLLQAEAEKDGPEALKMLDDMYNVALQLVPL